MHHRITSGVTGLHLEATLSHNKCQHFSHEERQAIRRIYYYAERIHEFQKRKDGRPYMIHIDESLDIYIHNSLSIGEKADAKNIMRLVGHDCLEDAKPAQFQYVLEIAKEFGDDFFIDLLWMSRPSEDIIRLINYIQIQLPQLFERIKQAGFIEKYQLLDSSDPENWIQDFIGFASLTNEHRQLLRGYWFDSLDYNYHATSDPKKKTQIFGELLFMAMVLLLRENLFLVKATERRHNMQDHTGLLNQKGVNSARKTLRTTQIFYTYRARELGLVRLREALFLDMINEFRAFVTHGLIILSEDDMEVLISPFYNRVSDIIAHHTTKHG